MYLKIPKQFAKDLQIQEHINKMNLAKTIIFYIIDSKFRRSVNLQKWLGKETKTILKEKITLTSILVSAGIKDTDSNIIKCRKTLKWVHSNIKYVSDNKSNLMNEYWQTPVETLEKRTGDCEDGAILLYTILSFAGVPNRQLRMVAGDVEKFGKPEESVGHAYLVWLNDEDGLEYPIDWTYWYGLSFALTEPYVMRKNYYYGQKEWFSFNSETAYRRKMHEEK